jgi:hypothetical protein
LPYNDDFGYEDAMSTSDILATVGIALSIVGIPLAFILARRGRKRPYLRQLVDFDVIASSKHGGFHSGFLRDRSGDPVTNIARTSAAIWNHQGDTIRGKDIVPDDRLRIQLASGDHALQARIVGCSRKQNKLRVDVDPVDDGVVYIDFDFLDADDGGIVELIHQGSTEPQILGTIRGADVGTRRKADLRPELIQSANRSWLKRYKLLPRRLRVVPVAMFGLFLVVTMIVAVFELLRTPILVDVAKYDLRSLTGQKEFSQDVMALGLPSSTGLWMAAIGVVMMATTLSVQLRERLKVAFPRSLVKILEPVVEKHEPRAMDRAVTVASAADAASSTSSSE